MILMHLRDLGQVTAFHHSRSTNEGEVSTGTGLKGLGWVSSCLEMWPRSKASSCSFCYLVVPSKTYYIHYCLLILQVKFLPPKGLYWLLSLRTHPVWVRHHLCLNSALTDCILRSSEPGGQDPHLCVLFVTWRPVMGFCFIASSWNFIHQPTQVDWLKYEAVRKVMTYFSMQ